MAKYDAAAKCPFSLVTTYWVSLWPKDYNVLRMMLIIRKSKRFVDGFKTNADFPTNGK
jgi:hypothetical protein